MLLISIALTLLYFATRTTPYKEYPATFQQRGDEITTDRFPRNASDSLFLMQIEQLQFKDETRNELNENKINWSGVIVSGCLLIGAFVSILGLFFDWFEKKRANDIFELKTIVIDNHKENKLQHTQIYKILEVVEDITVRKNIAESFRSIARNYMHYQKGSIPEDLQTLITAQAERLIELSEQIMTERFSIDVYDVTVVKIEEQCRMAWHQVIELFGKEFLSYYKNAQANSVTEFKCKLRAIVEDTEFNGKYDRYKRAAEYFLDDLIRMTIAEYKRFKSTE